MLDPKIIANVMRSATDQILTFITAHERDDHGGELCPTSRVYTTAWLGMALGLPVDPRSGVAVCMAMQVLRGEETKS